MKAIFRGGLATSGIFFLLLGLGCLNYTKAGGLERHTHFAIEHGLPQPSETILQGGALSLIVGAGLLGYLTGSRQQKRSQ